MIHHRGHRIRSPADGAHPAKGGVPGDRDKVHVAEDPTQHPARSPCTKVAVGDTSGAARDEVHVSVVLRTEEGLKQPRDGRISSTNGGGVRSSDSNTNSRR